jgi:hypothetical protein
VVHAEERFYNQKKFKKSVLLFLFAMRSTNKFHMCMKFCILLFPLHIVLCH